jgi:hypothetical protein
MMAETVLPAAQSASLVTNNVTASPSYLAYAHQTQIVIVDVSGEMPSRADQTTPSQITSLNYVALGDAWILVAGLKEGAHFYSEDGVRVLGTVQSPTPGLDGSPVSHNGACARLAEDGTWHVLLGTSTNYLDVIACSSDGSQIAFLSNSQPSSVGITSECMDICCYGQAGVASVHAQGELILWCGVPEAPYYTPIQTVHTVGVPTVIRPVSEFLAVAYGSGTVRFFSMQSLDLHAEADLHGRLINAMDSHPAGLLVTAGEDTIVNVVQIDPSSGDISIRNSQCCAQKLLTGACFLKTEALSVAVTAYDAANVWVLTL